MFAVGAMDAYFCDAYTDVVAATVISKSRQPSVILPDFFYEIKFPVRAILEPYNQNPNWRWRMAARQLMERESVLRLKTVQDLFNKFFRKGRRFFRDLLPGWVVDPEATKRVFGIAPIDFAALPAHQQGQALDKAQEHMAKRYKDIFQRRHDCIHNCDRPKVALQPLKSANTVSRVLEDVDFLVNRCDAHINAEFRQFLLAIGCTGTTVNQAGY
jgi:hypothetical protein